MFTLVAILPLGLEAACSRPAECASGVCTRGAC